MQNLDEIRDNYRTNHVEGSLVRPLSSLAVLVLMLASCKNVPYQGTPRIGGEGPKTVATSNIASSVDLNKLTPEEQAFVDKYTDPYAPVVFTDPRFKKYEENYKGQWRNAPSQLVELIRTYVIDAKIGAMTAPYQEFMRREGVSPK